MPLRGSIRVPSDKSISHRAVLFSGLARGTSHVADLLPSDDVLRSLDAISALGAIVDVEAGEHGLSGSIEGIGGSFSSNDALSIDCGNSGTTARLLLGVLSGLGARACLHGDESLSTRPMERVMKPLRAMGAHFESARGTLPIAVDTDTRLNGIEYASPVSSAQVKSAVLLAGLFARGRTSVTEPAKSRDHTELMLPAYGVNVRVDGLRVDVEGPSTLEACDVRVPADPSSAAFIAVAAALMEGSDVLIERVLLNPTRTGAFEVMKRMGADLAYERCTKIGAELVGDVRVRYSPQLHATRVHEAEIPTLIDEIPILALLAACATGTTVFESCGELRVKESDRFAAIRECLAAFGVQTIEQGDDLSICGCDLSPASEHIALSTRHDHRLAMAYYLAGVVAGTDVQLDDTACVSVSWPTFFDDIAALQ